MVADVDRLIENLLGQADYLWTELQLLRQRHELLVEDHQRAGARCQWLETVLRAATGHEVDLDDLTMAVVVGEDDAFATGELVVLNIHSLSEPFGAKRTAAPEAVELFGHDVNAATRRSHEFVIVADGPPDESPLVPDGLRRSGAGALGHRRRWPRSRPG